MNKKPYYMKNIITLFTVILLACQGLNAQSILYDQGQQGHIRVEVNKPLFKGDGIGFFSIANFINGHFKLGSTNTLAVELPVSRFTGEGFGGDFSSTDIGNIGVAFQLRNQENANFFEFKARLPTADDDVLFGGSVGILTDYTERFTAFVPDLISVGANYFLTNNAGMGAYFRFKPGIDLLIPTQDEADNELLAYMSVAGGYRSEKIDWNAAIASAIIITEDDIDFGERINRQFISTVSFTSGSFHPGAIIRVPLGNDINEVYDLSIGVSLNFLIGANTSTAE